MSKYKDNFFLVLLFISISSIIFYANSAMVIGIECASTTVTSSSGEVWPNETCWYTYSGTPDYQQQEQDPFFDEHGGSSSTGTSHSVYNGNDLDADADSAIDCWKNVTETGDYTLGDEKDFGPRTSGYHKGIDISGALGTALFSPAYMQVTEVVTNGIVSTPENPQSGNGAFVRGEFYSNGSRYQAVLIHMENGSPIVTEGQILSPGDYIGNMNETGGARGNHLHLEIKQHISYQDIDSGPDKNGNYNWISEFASIDAAEFLGYESCTKS